MPRFARPIPAGVIAHVVTRGNARRSIFHADADYRAFIELMRSAQSQAPLDLFAWCLMPNHIHLVVRPRHDRALSSWMHWLLTTHGQRFRIRHGTTGRIWQGRYKAFPIQDDAHLLTVLRYVERNPVRAALVTSAKDWRWSSLVERESRPIGPPLLAAAPIPLPSPWTEFVNIPLTDTELEHVRLSCRRGRPFGEPGWTLAMAERLDLQGTLRPRGRPRTNDEKGECPLFPSPIISG